LILIDSAGLAFIQSNKPTIKQTDKPNAMVGDNIKIMKTTFDFNFDFKQHRYTKTWKQREAVN